MTKKRNTFLNITAIISLVIFGYLLFFTVYHQMISQNEGFFYIIIFGGILILAYVLLSLMTKLLAFSRENTEGFIWLILEGIFIIAIAILFFITRTSYLSSIPQEECSYYKAAVLMNKGTISVGAADLMPTLLKKPATFIYAYILSVLIGIVGEVNNLIFYVNCVFLFITAFFAYRITRQIGDRICSLLAFIVILFMPSLGFSVYNQDTQLLFSAILMMAVSLTVSSHLAPEKSARSLIYLILSGLVWGLALCIEPVSILILLFILLYDLKNPYMVNSLALLLAVIVFFGIIALKSGYLEQNFTDVFSSSILRFSPVLGDGTSNIAFSDIFNNFSDKIDAHQKSITDNYYFLTTVNGTTYSALAIAWLGLGNQVLYMFLIVLAIACSFYFIRSGNARIIPILFCIISGFLVIFFTSDNEYNSIFFLCLLIITASVSLRYMYDNHHALADENLHAILGEDEVEVVTEEEIETEEERQAFLLRANALIFIGENEGYYGLIKEEERKAINAKIAMKTPTLVLTGPTENDKVTDNGNDYEPVDNHAKIDPVNSDDYVEAVEYKEVEVIPEPEPEPEEIEYLESPLPLPKKHVPKTLDYDKIDDDEDWDFDYDDTDEDDLDDFDDFDI